MSASLNKATIIGNLGRDPEVRHTASGNPVCNFSVATTERYKNGQGEQQERTEWHDVVAWGRLAELCGQYLGKGKQVYVEGRLQTREWDGKDGTKQRRKEIVAGHVVFLGGARGFSGGAGDSAREAAVETVQQVFGEQDTPF